MASILYDKSRFQEYHRYSKIFDWYSKIFNWKTWNIGRNSWILSFSTDIPRFSNLVNNPIFSIDIPCNFFRSIIQEFQSIVDKPVLSPIFQDFRSMFQDYQNIVNIPRFSINISRFSIDKLGLSPTFQDFRPIPRLSKCGWYSLNFSIDILIIATDNPVFSIDKPRISIENLGISTIFLESRFFVQNACHTNNMSACQIRMPGWKHLSHSWIYPYAYYFMCKNCTV